MNKNNLHVLILAGVFLFFIFSLSETIGQTIFPTGTTIYKPSEAYSSYILISDHAKMGNHPDAKTRAENTGTFPDDIRLIDMNGKVVHTWKVEPAFNKRSRLLSNGHLVYAGPTKMVIEYDWDGNEVWRHEGIGSKNDLRILPNNSSFQNKGLGSEVISHCERECIGRGFNALYLEVFLDNPANKLYERLGYEIYKVTKSHYLMKKCLNRGAK